MPKLGYTTLHDIYIHTYIHRINHRFLIVHYLLLFSPANARRFENLHSQRSRKDGEVRNRKNRKKRQRGGDFQTVLEEPASPGDIVKELLGDSTSGILKNNIN